MVHSLEAIMALKYEDRFDKLEVKLDNLDTKLDAIIVVQAKQQVILDDHIQRTVQVENALIPLKAQQNQIVGAGKLVALLGILATIVTAFFKFFDK